MCEACKNKLCRELSFLLDQAMFKRIFSEFSSNTAVRYKRIIITGDITIHCVDDNDHGKQRLDELMNSRESTKACEQSHN